MEPLAELIGESPAIGALRAQIARLLERQTEGRRLPPVLFLGETGTGKGLTARLLHQTSPRASGPFVSINCAAVPETLIESELFGFERGAFTDAHRAKPGLFESADHGTLFLDEIGSAPREVQSKLLTAIEDRTVRRLGSTQSVRVDVWIFAATSKDLPAAVAAGRFPPDLYHRLSALRFSLPPLRERGRDIITLAQHFLGAACRDYGLPPLSFAPDAEAALLAYSWPGNIRELANVMERVAVLADDTVVTQSGLGLPVRPSAAVSLPAAAEPRLPLRVSLGGTERAALAAALDSSGGNLSRAAVLVGMSRNTLRYRLEKYGLRAHRVSRARVDHSIGTADDPRAEAPATTATDSPGEQRLVAFLSIGFEEADPSRPDRLDETDVEDKIEAFGGQVEESDATRVVGVFGLGSSGDASGSAVHAALAIRNAADHHRLAGEGRLGVKTLIHVTTCQVTPIDGGHDLDPLAREQVLATLRDLATQLEPDAIFVSPTALPLLQPQFAFVTSAKGGAAPALARLVARAPVVSRNPSIAVLPFRNLTNEPEQDYLGDGMTEDIIGALSRLRWLLVIGRTSTLVYKSRVADVRQIATELGVRYILTGTVRRLANELRVTTDLVDAEAGNTVWAEHFDGEMGRIFEFQDSITARLAGTLDARVRSAEIQRAMRKHPDSLDAYDCVLRSLALMHRLSNAEFALAGDLLLRAISLDPGFAAAYGWRAWWHLFRIGQGWVSAVDRDFSEVDRFAGLALEHDPDDPMALAISAHTAGFVHRDFPFALRRFERSLALNPNSAFAWGMSAATFNYHGEPGIALERVNHALRLSPFDLLGFVFCTIASLAEMLLGRFEQALDWARRAYDENPRFSATIRQLAACLVHLGRVDEARVMAGRFARIETDFRLSTFRERYPLTDRAALDLYVESLRTAGLPE